MNICLKVDPSGALGRRCIRDHEHQLTGHLYMSWEELVEALGETKQELESAEVWRAEARAAARDARDAYDRGREAGKRAVRTKLDEMAAAMYLGWWVGGLIIRTRERLATHAS